MGNGASIVPTLVVYLDLSGNASSHVQSSCQPNLPIKVWHVAKVNLCFQTCLISDLFVFDATHIWPISYGWPYLYPHDIDKWLFGSPPFFAGQNAPSNWGVAPKWHRRKSSTCRGLRQTGIYPPKNAGIVGRWCDISSHIMVGYVYIYI